MRKELDRQTDGHAVHLVHVTALHHTGRDAYVGSAYVWKSRLHAQTNTRSLGTLSGRQNLLSSMSANNISHVTSLTRDEVHRY